MTTKFNLPILALPFILLGCTEIYDPNYNPSSGGYHDPYYGGYDSSYDYDRRREIDRAHRERHQLEHERDKLDNERERLEEERRRLEEERYRKPPAYTPPPREERCPPGFSPSEQKCSAEERRRGCKDMRLPGGLGCVHR